MNDNSPGRTDLIGPGVKRDERSSDFFDAAARGAFLLRHCPTCDSSAAPEARCCATCGGTDLEAQDAAGTGTLVSWTVLHRPPHPGFEGHMPLAIGIVELSEGPWLHLRIITEDVSSLRSGQPIRIDFVHPDQGESHPVGVA